MLHNCKRILVWSCFWWTLVALPVWADSSYDVVSIESSACRHGLHPQPDGGPFSLFVFCDEALGSNIGVILTEPGAGPGSIERHGQKIWTWVPSRRFWQEPTWAADVTSFVWSPSRKFVYVATSGVYGDGGVFQLDLEHRRVTRIIPDPSARYADQLRQGFLTRIQSVDRERRIVTISVYQYHPTSTLIATEEVVFE